MTNGDPWARVLELIKDTLSPTSYETWFRPLKIITMTDSRIVLGIDDAFAVANLKRRYNTLMSSAVREAYGREYNLVFLDTHEPIPAEYLIQMPDENQIPLNPKYKFDTFVVGAGNRFAHAACLAVAELPSDAYNPLFIYGGAGLGKTHLLQAIAHYIMADAPSLNLLYITSENFMNQLVAAIAKKQNQEFRDRFRTVDVLMIDDIQFLSGKTATQEEFFHTFNHLHNSGKQIVISSDRPPKDIPTLEDRLRSRFEWGLICDIQKPDYETRLAILQKKADEEGIEIPDEGLQYIADRVESNIRELEGLLTRVNAYSMLNQLTITTELVHEALGNILPQNSARRVTPDLIIDVVSGYYNVERGDMLSDKRNREIALPRQIAMYLTREMTNLSTTRIGTTFGGRDHTTVLFALKKIASSVKGDHQLRSAVDKLKSEIAAR
jgi:chromosomal replication initiator protein